MVTESKHSWQASTDWLTIPDLTEILQLSPGRIRRLIEDRQLLAVRIDNVLKIPSAFLHGNEPVEKLSGTATLLFDSGFSNDDAVRWLLEPEESLGASPIELLREGRKGEVRRLAQSLAL